jgi:transposase InsO family protein
MGCKIAPATYYEHRSRTPTAREVRDAELKPKIAAAHAANYGVFGARKVWLTLNRERDLNDPPIARCTVERLMGELGLVGAVRGKVKRTTISDPRATKPHDLVNRNFRPLAPDRLWVADFTYVSTWSGWCYTAFVIDAYALRILGLVGRDHDDQPARRRRRRAGRASGPGSAKAATSPAWWHIMITAASTCPSPTPNTSPPPGSSPPPARSVPRSTTPSPNP